MFKLRNTLGSIVLGVALTGGLLVTGFAPVVATAQAISGTIVGLVKDSKGELVANATVVATNSATGVASSITANSSGQYRISNLPAGTYDISVNSTGFSNYQLRGFIVELNKTSTADLVLSVAGNTTTVEVSADMAVALDTTTAQLGTSYSALQLSNLPTATFDVLNLSLLSAGVASSGGVGAGSGPTVGGQRPRDNNFTIEGIDNNDKSVTGPLLFVPNDAVSEFTVLQNVFSAQYGHSNAGQFNTVILSGTNKFHGKAYEYFQNRNLNAIDASQARSDVAQGNTPKNPRFDDNRFGGQVGGPIFRNKLFFFSNYDQEPIGQPGATASFCAPTADGFTALDGAGLSAANLGVYKKYSPVASTQAGADDAICPSTVVVNDVTIPIGDVGVTAGSFVNNYRSTDAVDYTLSDKDSFRFRYLYNRSDGPDTAATFPSFWASSPHRYHLATLSEFHSFSPGLTNEFRVGFNRYYSFVTAPGEFPGLDAFPNITIDELNGVNIGPDGNAPQGTIQNTYQGVDTVLWTKGKHSIAFGYEYRNVISPQAFVQRSRGDYEWSTLGGFLQDLSPDTFGERNATAPGVSATYYGNQHSSYAFANDDWRISEKLTLNLGVRYEFTSVPLGQQQQVANKDASVAGLITFGVPKSQKTNFVPRVGFAYSLDSKTVFRGGFGMGFDVLYDNLGILSAAPQYQITEDVDTSVDPTPGFLAAGGLPATVSIPDIETQRALTTAYIANQKLPYAENWSLGVERTIGKDYTLEVRYVGTRGIHLPTQNRLNRQSVVTLDNSLPTYFSPTTITSGTALSLADVKANGSSFVGAYADAGFDSNNLVSFQPWAESNYNGLAVQLTRRFSHGLQINAAYTWSKTMDDATADVFSTYLTPRRPQDFRNVGGDYSRSALDHTNRLTIATVYDLPIFQHSTWLKRNLLGNWEVAPIYTYQSPEYATVQSNLDSNINGDSAGDRVYVNPAGKKGTGTTVSPIYDPSLLSKCAKGKNCDANLVGYQADDPNAYYVVGGSGTLPNASRNTLAIRPIDNLDVTAAKRISFGERLKFEFQAQAFNVLNHSQYLPGSVNNINSLGYTDGATHNYLIPGTASFNHPEAVFSNNARAMQLVAKIVF